MYSLVQTFGVFNLFFGIIYLFLNVFFKITYWLLNVFFGGSRYFVFKCILWYYIFVCECFLMFLIFVFKCNLLYQISLFRFFLCIRYLFLNVFFGLRRTLFHFASDSRVFCNFGDVIFCFNFFWCGNYMLSLPSCSCLLPTIAKLWVFYFDLGFLVVSVSSWRTWVVDTEHVNVST